MESLAEKFKRQKLAHEELSKPKDFYQFCKDTCLMGGWAIANSIFNSKANMQKCWVKLDTNLGPNSWEFNGNTLSLSRNLWAVTGPLDPTIDFYRAKAIAEFTRQYLFSSETRKFYSDLILFHMGFDPFKELTEAKQFTATAEKLIKVDPNG